MNITFLVWLKMNERFRCLPGSILETCVALLSGRSKCSCKCASSMFATCGKLPPWPGHDQRNAWTPQSNWPVSLSDSARQTWLSRIGLCRPWVSWVSWVPWVPWVPWLCEGVQSLQARVAFLEQKSPPDKRAQAGQIWDWANRSTMCLVCGSVTESLNTINLNVCIKRLIWLWPTSWSISHLPQFVFASAVWLQKAQRLAFLEKSIRNLEAERPEHPGRAETEQWLSVTINDYHWLSLSVTLFQNKLTQEPGQWPLFCLNCLQVWTPGSCNCSRRAAEAVAEAFEGVATLNQLFV